MKRYLIIGAGLLVVAAAYVFLSRPVVEIRNPHPSGHDIVCFGDSLTYGTGAAPGMDYPSQLQAMIGRKVVNAGVPGDTTSGALERLERDVLSHDPGIVLITLGGNDLKNGVGRDEAFANMENIIRAIQDKGALVVVGGIDVPLFGRGFGPAYEEVCARTGAVLVPNIYKGIFGRDEYMSDPIHPNDEGYRMMAGLFHEAIMPYVSRE